MLRVRAGGRSSDLRARPPFGPEVTYWPSLPRSCCGPSAYDGGRSRLPLRGSPGISPGSLLRRVRLGDGANQLRRQPTLWRSEGKIGVQHPEAESDRSGTFVPCPAEDEPGNRLRQRPCRQRGSEGLKYLRTFSGFSPSRTLTRPAPPGPARSCRSTPPPLESMSSEAPCSPRYVSEECQNYRAGPTPFRSRAKAKTRRRGETRERATPAGSAATCGAALGVDVRYTGPVSDTTAASNAPSIPRRCSATGATPLKPARRSGLPKAVMSPPVAAKDSAPRMIPRPGMLVITSKCGTSPSGLHRGCGRAARLVGVVVDVIAGHRLEQLDRGVDLAVREDRDETETLKGGDACRGLRRHPVLGVRRVVLRLSAIKHPK